MRRLLAAPTGRCRTPDVVARLDAAVAELVAERAPRHRSRRRSRPPGTRRSRPLAARRRRWPMVAPGRRCGLVGGYGIGAAASGVHGRRGERQRRVGAGGADSAAAGRQRLLGRGRRRRGFGDGPSASAPRTPTPGWRARSRCAVRRTCPPLRRRTPPGAATAPTSSRRRAREFRRCVLPAAPTARPVFAVRYDGEPAVLVVGPERSGRVRAQVSAAGARHCCAQHRGPPRPSVPPGPRNARAPRIG